MVIQLIGVPVFTYFWGLHDYGTWLPLYAYHLAIALVMAAVALATKMFSWEPRR